MINYPLFVCISKLRSALYVFSRTCSFLMLGNIAINLTNYQTSLCHQVLCLTGAVVSFPMECLFNGVLFQSAPYFQTCVATVRFVHTSLLFKFDLIIKQILIFGKTDKSPF